MVLLKNALFFAFASVKSVSAVTVTEYASLDLPSAAVATFVAAPSGLGSEPSSSALLATTFSPTSDHDSILLVTNLDGNLTVTVVDGDAVWPNQADPVAAGVVADSRTGTASSSSSSMVLGAGGFFVNVPGHPDKSTGTVDLFQPSSNSSDSSSSFTKTQLSENDAGFFYHKAVFMDTNGDGLQDVMAARCYVPKYGLRPDKSELVVMLQPSPSTKATAHEEGKEERSSANPTASSSERSSANPTASSSAKDSASGNWDTSVVVTDGPDVSFVLTDLDNDGRTQVIATEYFVNQRLALYMCNSSTDNASWAECADSVASVAIDDTEGTMFNLAWVDLNLDGVKDLLVTSQGDDGSGKVLAYEQPSPDVRGAWASAPWTKHVLADGYKPLKAYLPGRGSPGTAISFPAPPSFSDERPWVAVSADDGGWVDLLVPSGGDGWAYNKTRVVQSTGTIGTVAAGDIDGDGVAELFIPLYDEGRLAMYSIDLDNL